VHVQSLLYRMEFAAAHRVTWWACSC